tara:strand:- start:386 stop:634 length:249 start_codon:yes stop_codon:yes gene_type:complete
LALGKIRLIRGREIEFNGNLSINLLTFLVLYFLNNSKYFYLSMIILSFEILKRLSSFVFNFSFNPQERNIFDQKAITDAKDQ